MKTETRTLDGPVDFELGQSRSRPLSYVISTPDHGKPRGLVFLIPGFGGDASAAYAESLRRHVCDTHGVAAVSVAYHCIEARPENGASLGVSMREHLMLIGLAAHAGIQVANYADINELSARLGPVAETGMVVQAYADITPGGGEYQNFGILQAMDHLAVLADIVATGPDFDRSRIIAFGSSHGGYIAHLMAKLAPASLSAVMDNSSYCQPPMHYLGIGSHGEYRNKMGAVNLVCRVKSGWNLDIREGEGFYSRDADLIRDTAYPPHLAVMRAAGRGGPAFLMVNAAEDNTSPPEIKRRQAALMRGAGLDARLDMIDGSQIDGIVFKELTHGLNASLRSLFDRMVPGAPQRSGPLDCETGAVIDYPCVDRGYRFTHGAAGVKGEIYDLYPIENEGAEKAA